jgi:hypothetical protein
MLPVDLDIGDIVLEDRGNVDLMQTRQHPSAGPRGPSDVAA